MNAIALAFILGLDELIFETLFSDTAKFMIDELQPLPLYDEEEQDNLLDAYQQHQKNRQFNLYSPRLLRLVFPTSLVGVISVTFLFQMKYYTENCRYMEDGSMVPKD